MPTKLSAASHHMYQTIAKPNTVLSAARMKPAPVLLGMRIARKPDTGRW